jgi:hypothetical protein
LQNEGTEVLSGLEGVFSRAEDNFVLICKYDIGTQGFQALYKEIEDFLHEFLQENAHLGIIHGAFVIKDISLQILDHLISIIR